MQEMSVSAQTNTKTLNNWFLIKEFIQIKKTMCY